MTNRHGRFRGTGLPLLLIFPFLFTGMMAGCALNAQGVEEVAAVYERQQAETPRKAPLYASVPATRPAGVEDQEVRTAETLREYLVLALQENPDIRQAGELARARARRIPQVTALPDPILSTKTLPEPVRTAEGDNFFVLGVSQKLPVPGKLDRAGRIALEETRMAIAAWEQTRLRVIADVKRSYFRIYIIDRSREIIRENQELLRGLIDTARMEVATGKRTQDDVLRAQVELSNLDARLIELRQQRTSAEAMLNNLLNRAPATPVPSPESFDVRQVDTTLAEMMSRAAAANPELRRLANQIDRDREAVELARLAYWPDFNVGFEWMHMKPREAFRPPPNPQTGKRPAFSRMSEEGTDNWAIMFGFNLPIWYEKIDAGIREARAKASASAHEYASAKNMVHFRIEEALAGVEAQRELAVLFDSTIVPQARQAYEIARAGYKVGKSDFQFVIDNWQKWLAFEIQYHRAVGELERSVADLEQAIGLSLEELEGGVTDEP